MEPKSAEGPLVFSPASHCVSVWERAPRPRRCAGQGLQETASGLRAGQGAGTGNGRLHAPSTVHLEGIERILPFKCLAWGSAPVSGA